MTSMRNGWICVCDFDGTITTADATDQLLEAYATPEWLEIESDWKNGLIGSHECLARQISLIKASRAKITDFARSITIDPEFKRFAEFCDENSVKLAIVSDGLDCLIDPILKQNKLSHIPVFANALWTSRAGVHALVSPHRDENCSARAGTCKCAVISDLRDGNDASRVLYVGDGRSDFCAAARSADVIAAKSSLAKHLSATGKKYFPFASFEDIRVLLAGLIAPRATQNRIEIGILHERY